MNILSNVLHNHYVLLRHGRSQANEAEIIVSDPQHGVSGYGLTAEGREAVSRSVLRAKDTGLLNEESIIYSSDFMRARETAQIAAHILGISDIHTTEALRERYFGTWDGKDHNNYHEVWRNDQEDHTHTIDGVESIESVKDRTLGLIDTLESQYSGATLLLVSHGDTLDILRTAILGGDLATFSNGKRIGTAEIIQIA